MYEWTISGKLQLLRKSNQILRLFKTSVLSGFFGIKTFRDNMHLLEFFKTFLLPFGDDAHVPKRNSKLCYNIFHTTGSNIKNCFLKRGGNA